MKIIGGDVDLRRLYLKELPEFLKDVEITGKFDCSENQLVSLKTSQKSVNLSIAVITSCTLWKGLPRWSKEILNAWRILECFLNRMSVVYAW